MARAKSKTGDKKSLPTKQTDKKTTTTVSSALPAKAVIQGPIQQLRSDIDRLFEDFGRTFNLPTLRSRLFDTGGWSMPRLAFADEMVAMDVNETDKSFDISVELPGMNEDDIEVSVSNHTLTVSGEKIQEELKEEGATHVHERHFGSFRRSFRLPPEADTNNIAASVAKGVLSVSVPKRTGKKSKVKKIAVKPQS